MTHYYITTNLHAFCLTTVDGLFVINFTRSVTLPTSLTKSMATIQSKSITFNHFFITAWTFHRFVVNKQGHFHNFICLGLRHRLDPELIFKFRPLIKPISVHLVITPFEMSGDYYHLVFS